MNIFITGSPGCGKSTLVRELISASEDKKIAGILSPDIRHDYRVGFEIVDLPSGKKEIMASIQIEGEPRVGKYGVNINGVNKIVDIFMKSFEDSELVFIDEIGKMEFFSARFKQMIEHVLSSNKKIVASLHRNLVSEFKHKGTVFYLTHSNKEEVKGKILDLLKK